MEKLSYEQLQQKIQHFCAYRERCEFEVKKKLKELGADDNQSDEIIDELKNDNFLDDNRFTEIFVKSKLKHNKWGKLKIEAALKQLNITNDIIRKHIGQIDEKQYEQTLNDLISKKIKDYNNCKYDTRKNNIARYCIQKGFEPTIVWQFVNK